MSYRQQQQQQQQTPAVTSGNPAAAQLLSGVMTPSAAATAITKSKVDYVQVDALVALKIMKHCQELGDGAELVQGILTGMINPAESGSKRIEVTNSFGLPNPNLYKNIDYNQVCNELMADNLKHFRHLNFDHMGIGWYQSSLFGSFVNKTFIEDHFMYQTDMEDSIVLIYDPFKSQHGSLYLKAFRLTSNMMELEKRKDFSAESIKQVKLNHENFMEELPVVIKNSHLVNSMLCQLQDMSESPKRYNFLDLSTSNVLEKTMRSLIENTDELALETNKYLMYHKQLQKQNHMKQQYLQKREAENTARRSRGEPPLPEEDLNKMFKPIPAVSRLESLLISNQIKSFCQQINEFSAQSFSNLFIAEGVQNK